MIDFPDTSSDKEEETVLGTSGGAFELWWRHLEGTHKQIEVCTDPWNLEHLKTAQKLNQHQIGCLYSALLGAQTRRPIHSLKRSEYIKDKVLPWIVIPLEKFTVTHIPVAFKERIPEEQQQQDTLPTGLSLAS